MRRSMTAQPAWPLLPAWSSLRQVRSVRDFRGELLGFRLVIHHFLEDKDLCAQPKEAWSSP